MTATHSIAVACLLAAAIVAGCDTVAPVDESRIVVHGFLNSGRPLPQIQVHHTLSPTGRYDASAAAVRDASVSVVLDGETVTYAPDSLRHGTYRAADDSHVTPGAGTRYEFRAVWRGEIAEASGTVPPEIDIVGVSVSVPVKPVSAVLLDSLALSDSLATGAYTGYIYPIEVAVEWSTASAAGWPGENSWIRAQLQPIALFSSPVVDLFLQSDEIFREAEQNRSSDRLTWTGVYAVGVAEADARLPEHRLRIALVRSGPDYARFAASRNAPERREPISNVNGGIGIFAAVSVDSTHLDVTRTGVTVAETLP